MCPFCVGFLGAMKCNSMLAKTSKGFPRLKQNAEKTRRPKSWNAILGRWLSRSRVTAQAGYMASALNAGRDDYWMRFSNGCWKIIKVKHGPVS
jgi:hypothetical protein